MRILIVEDNEGIRTELKRYLEDNYYAVDVAATGEKGSYLARTNDYDLIILDYMLPDKDGSEVCKDIRNNGSDVPILILSALSDVESKIRLFELGVDDYITKPFSHKEMSARIKALLRRPHVIVPDIVTVGSLVIDSTRHRVLYRDQEIYLTRKEFSLLEYLARNFDIVVSRGMIMEHVWNVECDPFSNTIEAHIFNLRKKVVSVASVLIHTVPGRGYKLSTR